MKIAMVEWDDSATGEGWHKPFQDDKVVACLSFGLVLREDKRQLLLIPTECEIGLVSSALAIPRGCIKRIRYLKVKP